MSKPNKEILEVAWYLSKFGNDNPPSMLGVTKWKDATDLFYPRFGEGKTSKEFYNSLKNHRDRFDSGLNNSRKGWRNKDGSARDLPLASRMVMENMNALEESSINELISSYLFSSPFEKIKKDLTSIYQDVNLNDTMRDRLITARLGQGFFRKECLKRSPECPITHLTFEPLLRASHIKPWAACKNGNERLDPYNGIILAAHIDVLFDKGWISFTNDGEILISEEIDNISIKKIALPHKIKSFDKNSFEYLKWHRENVFRKNKKNNTQCK